MAPRQRRILFISNGHGEDAIAAEIIRRLPAGLIAEAYPTLGAGRSYEDVCPIVGPRAQLASEGWRNVKGSLARDVGEGGLKTLWPGLKFMRQSRNAYDRVVVVGDMIGVYGCALNGIRNILYLDVYKTGFGSGYLAVDKVALKRCAKTVFCRAESLAASLRDQGIDARCAGNVMMDAIPYAAYDAIGRRRAPLAVTLLPGSRAHAIENFALQAAALRLLPNPLPDLFAAVAPSLDVTTLATAAGLSHQPCDPANRFDLGTLSDADMTINLVHGAAMGNVLAASDIVLAQAGTATVQAVGLGKPAITFRTTHDRASRFADEGRLFGEARQVVEADAGAIALKLKHLLGDAAERERLATLGRNRIGPPGAIAAMIAAI